MFKGLGSKGPVTDICVPEVGTADVPDPPSPASAAPWNWQPLGEQLLNLKGHPALTPPHLMPGG